MKCVDLCSSVAGSTKPLRKASCGPSRGVQGSEVWIRKGLVLAFNRLKGCQSNHKKSLVSSEMKGDFVKGCQVDVKGFPGYKPLSSLAFGAVPPQRPESDISYCMTNLNCLPSLQGHIGGGCWIFVCAFHPRPAVHIFWFLDIEV